MGKIMGEVIIAYQQFKRCQHSRYSIEESTNTVTCLDCKKDINPVWALKRLSLDESLMTEKLKNLKQEIKRAQRQLEKKSES
jgi:hypothetical protein